MVRVNNVAIKLFGRIGFVLILLLPAFATSCALAPFYLLFGLDLAALRGLFGFDDKDLVTDVNTVGDGFLMVVFADDIFAEEAISAVVWRGSQAN